MTAAPADTDRLDVLLDEATLIVQLLFWIEEARAALGAVELFTKNYPDQAQRLQAHGYRSPNWGRDQTEAMLALHNLQLGKFAEVRREVAR